MRGLTYLAAQKPAEAAGEFQKIINRRGLVMEDSVDALARLQRARALVASGDAAGGRAAYQDFLMLWKQADPDIPLLKRTSRISKASVAHSEAIATVDLRHSAQ